MRQGSRYKALIVLLGLLLLSGCHKASEHEPQYIMLVFNGGSCEQNGSTGVIDVYQDAPIIYQGASSALTEFQLQFASCPFASCPVDSPHANSVNVGKPNAGSAGATFMYSAVSMNDFRCREGAEMGIRIQPRP